MPRLPLAALLAFSITTLAAYAGKVPTPAAARASAWADLQKLLVFAKQPATVSIATLSRQFGFSYTIRECRKVNDADDWCEYEVNYDRALPGEIDSASFGRDRTTGLPTANVSWRVRDSRICFTQAALEKLLGSGKELLPPMPLLLPGEPPPPFMTLFAHPAISSGNGVRASALYSGGCLSAVTIKF